MRATARRTGDAPIALTASAVLLAVGVAQLGDLLTFARMVGVAGIGAELNPIIARGAETLGMAALVGMKVALIVLVAAVFVVLARSHRRLAATIATAGTLAGLVGALSNVLAIA
jgi:hypothetical protein